MIFFNFPRTRLGSEMDFQQDFNQKALEKWEMKATQKEKKAKNRKLSMGQERAGDGPHLGEKG